MTSFEEALQKLIGSGTVSRRTPVSTPVFRMPERTSSPIDFTVGRSAGNFFENDKPKLDDQWWMKALDATAAIGRMGSQAVSGKFDSVKDLQSMITGKKKFDLGDFLKDFATMANPADAIGNAKAAWKGQREAWADGKPGFGDIGGGLLTGLGRHTANYENVLNKMGVGGKTAKWTGLGLDLLLDPSVYLTGGTTAAGKAGTAAMRTAAKGLAADAGIDLTRKALKSKTLADDVGGLLKNNYLTGQSRNLATKDMELTDIINKAADGLHTRTVDNILNAGKAVSGARKDDLFALSIPFTTKVTPALAKRPSWMKATPVTIGSEGALAANKIFEELGLNADEASKFTKSKYGVDSAEEMTKEALDHLRTQAPGFKALQTTDPNMFKELFKSEQIGTALNQTLDTDDILKRMAPQAQQRIAQMLDGMKNRPNTSLADLLKLVTTQAPEAAEMLGAAIGKMPGNTKGNAAKGIEQQLKDAADLMRNAKPKNNPSPIFDTVSELVKPKVTGDDFARSITDFVQGPSGRSALQRKIDKVNPFNMRSFKSEKAFVSNAGNYKADASTKIIGQNHQVDKQLRELNKQMTKNLTDTERKAVVHAIQGKFPKSIRPTPAMMTKISPYVDQLRSMLQAMADKEIAAGTLTNVRKNYFPHVMKPGVNLDDMPSMPEIDALRGQSQANNFAQERTGFQSLADWEDAVESLRASGKTDEADALAKLFESDPIQAVGQRAFKSIKSSAFKEMYGRMEADGLIVKKETAGVHRITDSKGKPDYVRVDSDMAKATGLEAGDMVHKDIVEGLKDVREMFTSEGMNKLLKTLGSVNSTWKLLVTSVPAHHYNNFVGNVAVNTMAGVGPGAYKEAFQLLKGMKAGKEPAFIKKAIDQGIIDQGFISDFVRSPFMDDTKMSGIDKLNKGISEFKPVKAMSNAGEYFDNVSRMAMYVDRMKRYGTAERAAEDVRKYLFNYSEMTSADRKIRAVVPFWNWIKNAVPMMTRSFYEHHGALQAYNKGKDAINESIGEDNPAYKSNNYLKIPGTNFGLPNRLPFSELDKFGTPLHMLKEGFNALTPVAKMPIELAMNKQFFNGAPVYGQDTPTRDIGEYLLRQTGVVGKAGTGIQDMASGEGNALDNFLQFIIGKPVRYE